MRSARRTTYPPMKTLLFLACIASGLLSLTQAAPQPNKTPDAPDSPKLNTQPWVPARYAHVKKSMAEKPCDILFVGDSITEQWEFVGKNPWDELLVPKNAVNFGVSGDRTESVLWRMEDTKLATTTPPKVCVLLIGTNNIGYWDGQQSASDTVKGIRKIATSLLEKFPKTHLIIFTTFPYGPDPKAPFRKLGNEIAKKTTQLKLPRTTILNINKHFLNPDGTFKPGIFKDNVHLTEQGYRVWAKQLMPVLNKYLPQTPAGK